MTLGNQTLTFRGFTEGALDVNGIAEPVPVEADVPGCLFEPLRATEKVGLVENIATQVWQAICPPNADVLAATAISEIEYLGDTYQVVGGVQPMTDFAGVINNIEVLAQKQSA